MAGRGYAGPVFFTSRERIPQMFVAVPLGFWLAWQVAQRLNDPTQNLTGDPVPVPRVGVRP